MTEREIWVVEWLDGSGKRHLLPFMRVEEAEQYMAQPGLFDCELRRYVPALAALESATPAKTGAPAPVAEPQQPTPTGYHWITCPMCNAHYERYYTHICLGQRDTVAEPQQAEKACGTWAEGAGFCDKPRGHWHEEAQKCETCGGEGTWPGVAAGTLHRCDTCDGTGRAPTSGGRTT
jgi:hypothetical protein